MWWWIVVGAYVASVVLCAALLRIHTKKYNCIVEWWDVIINLVPFFNIILVILVWWIEWESRDYPMPKWLIKLYGGRIDD